ncbi:uncharacterized protein PHACADRAFT_179035 [Phanerochaete carnosa HHB-10118-sp]|uniref:RNA helicase n=1 Tax=Phanerochaete carnosa (strain HHB-10118-sp) TaxID=650164 RepID=K5WHC4_PHACS|nr:uncharacterized protein PHACADRAFT_179035 [Phanerochaete carnosa HHB-10118-sp]EKM49622.1 hypothetical protein PHACADRAFT_179035 [Phanerochaete carnosa HHB-10118-sp]
MDDSDDENHGTRINSAEALKSLKFDAQSPRPTKKQKIASAGPSSSKHAAVQEQRKQLPIAQGADAIIQEMRDNDVTVLVGETGSGKTTQIPQYLLESGLARNGMIAVTQPRRVAATSLASRVSVETQSQLGSLVGYSVRFADLSSDKTKIKFVTDGMLVRELMSDSELERYSVVIIDEAHERTLRTDVLLARLKGILKKRNTVLTEGKGKGKERAPKNPLKVVIMSATLDAEKFSSFFGNAKILYVQGRQHPVTIYHAATPQPDYVDAALRTVFQIHTDQPAGDILVFLPGQEDIESLDKSIQLYAKRLPQDTPGILTCPLYASLSSLQQQQIFVPAPKHMRKVILATNIAETSVTIPWRACKEKRWVGRGVGGGFDTLLTRDITKSSAWQRTGRAGREASGSCFRLYTEDAFDALPLSAEPEIQRCSLTASMLQLKCLGQDLEDMEFMESPDEEGIAQALTALYLLSALDDRKNLTYLGRRMAFFPLEPPLSRAVIASVEFGCTSEVLTIVSVLSSSSKLFVDTTDSRDSAREAHTKFRHLSSDHLTVLNVVRAYEEVLQSEGGADGKKASKAALKDWCVRNYVSHRCLTEAFEIRTQLREYCEHQKIDWRTSCGDKVGEEQAVLRSLVRGLVQNTAFLQPDGRYKQVIGHSIVKIHPGSSLCDKKVPAIVYDELVYTTQIYARNVSAIPRNYIAEVPLLKNRRG